MKSQIESSFSEEFLWIKLSQKLLHKVKYNVMEASSFHEGNE